MGGRKTEGKKKGKQFVRGSAAGGRKINDPGDQKQKGRKVKNSSSGYASIPRLAIQLTCYGYARVCGGGGPVL